MGEELKVFRTWSSPYALRVVWALELKGLKYDTVYENLPIKSPLLLQYNPVHKKVPVLVHAGKPIAESLIIVEYIDETWNQNPLLPQDSYERALARFWAKFGDDKVNPSIWKVFNSQGKDEEAIEVAWENLKYLEEYLKGKKFFGGEVIGFVDLAFGWLANLVNIWEEIIGISVIPQEKFPHLFKWTKDFADAPIIKDNWPSRERLFARFQASLPQSSTAQHTICILIDLQDTKFSYVNRRTGSWFCIQQSEDYRKPFAVPA